MIRRSLENAKLHGRVLYRPIGNAVPTAEGAVQLVMEKTRQTLRGRKALIIGYGRVGKILAHQLFGMGAKVTVAARKSEDFAWIRAFGYDGLDTTRLQGVISDFDLVFNTVPALVLTYSRLAELKKDCLVIDLASKPGGADFILCKEAAFFLAKNGDRPCTSTRPVVKCLYGLFTH